MSRGLISAIFHSQRAVESLVVANWVDYTPTQLHSALFETTIVAGNAFSSEKSTNARKQKERKTHEKKESETIKKGKKGNTEMNPF